MNRKIYVVETASFDGKGQWDNETSMNYFSSKAKATMFCKKWMDIYKSDYPDGRIVDTGKVFHFIFADGAIEEYQIYPMPLN